MSRAQQAAQCCEPQAVTVAVHHQAGVDVLGGVDPSTVACTGQRRVAVGIGANIGTREECLARMAAAVRALADHAEIAVVDASRVMRTRPWGVTAQQEFLNGALLLRTGLAPMQLLEFLKFVERRVGRRPTFRWGPRVLDLDILVDEQFMLRTPLLTIPHEQLLVRAFAIEPLLEVWKDVRLPDGTHVRDRRRDNPGDILERLPIRAGEVETIRRVWGG